MSPPPELTLTALLNSLHTHLQSQTKLLPTLHLQLGLPPTALEDELKTIQQHLIQSLESQINVRRQEVQAWLEKCDAVEKQCIRYTRALGGNVKPQTGPSVGELRKEQVLPRRYELVSAHQEKLRQMYYTKLEQLTTLTARLKALARTLGPDFYTPDILEPTVSGGQPDNDKPSHRDVTPERFSKLEKELVRGKGEVAKRLSQLSTLFIQIDWLYTELGVAPPSLDTLPSPAKSNSRSASSSSAYADPFLSASVSTPTPPSRNTTAPLLFLTPDEPTRISDLECKHIFAQFVARVEAADESALDEGCLVGLEGVDPSPSLLQWSERTRADLEDIKRRREAHIQAMYDQLEALWRRLGVTEDAMDDFVEAHRGSTEVTVKAYEEELERMMDLKRERMGTFIGNARAEIVKLWDDLMIGEEERLDFAPFADDEHTEELLTIHEDEVKRLKDERRKKAPLLTSIKKYFEICDEEKELAAAASDQTRLLGRGVRGDPGRLLREEKMRKRVNKEKPRLEQDLLVSIPSWENEAGRPFLVYGERFLKMLMESVGVADQESSNNKRKLAVSRSGSAGPSATAPYVPGHGADTRRGAATPAPPTRPSSRAGSALGMSSNKRARVTSGRSRPATAVGAPVPLGSSVYGNAARPASPTKGKTPSSLPRPVSVGANLGAGRLPTSVGIGYGHRSTSSASSLSVSTTSSRNVTGTAVNVAVAAKKATRTTGESFKPRPSMDIGPLSAFPSSGRGWRPGAKEGY